MTDTSDLISRLEAATEGSRELDMEIFWLVFPEYERGKDPIWHCLHYTTSIDAPLTLLGKNDLWSVCSMEEGPYAQVIPAVPGGSFGEVVGNGGPTTAMALCIAVLRSQIPEDQ